LVTITGNGIGEYNFKNLPKEIKVSEFDVVVCDKNFKEDGKNILKLPYKEAKEFILSNYKSKNILYIVTGSPLFFSAGMILAKIIPKRYFKIIPNTSSKDYLLAKLAISEVEVDFISLHGRDSFDLSKFLRKKYTLILCDERSIDRIKEATKYLKDEDLCWIIGYKMGYSDEFIGEFNPNHHNFNLKEPFVLLLKREFEYSKLPLKDSDFQTQRGMITKEYKRNLLLEFLELQPNLILWDIGAGSGSCSIEAFRKYQVRTLLFEKNPTRVEFIKQNLQNHRVCETELFEGEATTFFEKISKNPDRVFVGGGGDEVLSRLGYLFDRLNPSGVMVIVAVTLKNLTKAIEVLEKEKIEAEIISINFTSWSGNLKMASPQRELFAIKVVKRGLNLV